ncbi:MAG: M23 family metallopeptidase [Burkholderiaceae bacterium]|nr:M23 family metallopeptidase [Burkholderiaceae bacterium]
MAVTVGSLSDVTYASIDETPVTPSLKRIEELFGLAGLSESTITWPVAGPYRISSTFGLRSHPIKRKRTFHYGLDIAAPTGTPIVSVAVGRVVFAGWRSGYGRVVEIEHGQGWISRYAHAKSLTVKKGQLVLAGQMIAKVGSSGHATGTHLHLELEQAGKRIDPMAFWAQVNSTSAQ